MYAVDLPLCQIFGFNHTFRTEMRLPLFLIHLLVTKRQNYMYGKALLNVKRHPHVIAIVSSHIGYSCHRQHIICIPDNICINRVKWD